MKKLNPARAFPAALLRGLASTIRISTGSKIPRSRAPRSFNLIAALSLFLFTIMGQTGNAQEKKESVDLSEKEFTIENCVNQFNMEGTIKTKVGYQYWFADKEFIDGRTLKMSVVAPHQATHPPHKHAVDEFFFILEGTAKFYLDGKTTVAGAYTSFYCPSNVPHGISNAGDTELKYLVIKKYED